MKDDEIITEPPCASWVAYKSFSALKEFGVFKAMMDASAGVSKVLVSLKAGAADLDKSPTKMFEDASQKFKDALRNYKEWTIFKL